MSKFTIIIEGTPEELDKIASQISDGGGEDAMTPDEYVREGRYLNLDYSKCFSAWGYDPALDGDPVITGKLLEIGEASTNDE